LPRRSNVGYNHDSYILQVDAGSLDNSNRMVNRSHFHSDMTSKHGYMNLLKQ